MVGAAARGTAFGESPAATLTGRAPARGTAASGDTAGVAATAAMPAVPAAAPTPYPDDPGTGPTQVLPDPATVRAGTRADGRSGAPAGGWRERLAPAGDAVRRRAGDLADRYRTAPGDVRLALVGTAITVVAFLLLPYARNDGTAAELGGRLWWRPIAAVAATVLLATTLRARAADGDRPATASGVDRLLTAVVVATVGVTEAGLVGIVSGGAHGVRAGYYGMLAGLLLVLVATVRAARRRCGA
jgi:hypothetical protein